MWAETMMRWHSTSCQQCARGQPDGSSSLFFLLFQVTLCPSKFVDERHFSSLSFLLCSVHSSLSLCLSLSSGGRYTPCPLLTIADLALSPSRSRCRQRMSIAVINIIMFALDVCTVVVVVAVLGDILSFSLPVCSRWIFLFSLPSLALLFVSLDSRSREANLVELNHCSPRSLHQSRTRARELVIAKKKHRDGKAIFMVFDSK